GVNGFWRLQGIKFMGPDESIFAYFHGVPVGLDDEPASLDHVRGHGLAILFARNHEPGSLEFLLLFLSSVALFGVIGQRGTNHHCEPGRNHQGYSSVLAHCPPPGFRDVSIAEYSRRRKRNNEKPIHIPCCFTLTPRLPSVKR